MAWTNSKVFPSFIVACMDNSVAFDVDLDVLKGALFDNTITPDNTVALAAAALGGGVWLAGPEVEDTTEWDAGGEPLVNADVTSVAAVVKLDADDLVSGGASATLSNVFGMLHHDSSVANNGICYNFFGGVQSVSDGVFTCIYNAANGILQITAT